MRGLHARHHPQPREAPDVALGEDLRVLDAEAQRARRRLLAEHALEGVEHERVRPVADGVHAHLEAARRRLRGLPVELVGRNEDEATCSRDRRSRDGAGRPRASPARRRT